MGMAASQARFLGLTARKSNVEYQGQQVNQQRTSLANESANLYNQMMDLTVPTPPSTNDYYTTSYVLEGSSNSYTKGDYSFISVAKTYEKEGEYLVTLENKREELAPINKTYTISGSKTTDGVYKFTTDKNGIKFQYSDKTDEKGNKADNPFLGENGSVSVVKGNIYSLAYAGENFDLDNLEGYTLANKELIESDLGGAAYFYQDKEGKNVFLSDSQFNAMKTAVDENKSTTPLSFATTYVKTKTTSTQVKGFLETSDTTGRFASLTINEDDSYPEELSGREFSLNVVQSFDENAYNDAFNDYEYEKAEYEKAISDINAQTEIIQAQDQQLELRLQQLDTEQKAISTEIDSVTKVIEDNVDKTFKVFA